MSITINTTAVAKAANMRVEGEQAEQFDGLGRKGGVTKLGSRVTKRQADVVAAVLTQAQVDTLRGSEEALANLLIYAETGEASKLTAEQNECLKKVVEQARERVSDNASQARRIWPRKVAAIIARLDAKPEEPKAETPAEGEQTGEGEQPAPETEESTVSDSEDNGDEQPPAAAEQQQEAPKGKGKK